MIKFTSFVLLTILAVGAHQVNAGGSASITITATIIRHCTATSGGIDCPPAVLQQQSSLPGSAKITTTDDTEPTVVFVGPAPTIETVDNTTTILF